MPATMSYYQQSIRELLAAQGRIGMDPRHVEAFMRLEHSTLDGLSRQRFAQEVRTCADCVEMAGSTEAELCAQSFGL